MAGIRASLDKLTRLRKSVAGMKQGAFKRVVGKAMGAAALKLVADEFRRQKDPYGAAWKPIRRKGKILQDTGRLRASFKATPKPYGFDVSTDVEYAGAHQFGAKIPKRKVGSSLRFKNRKGRFVSRAKYLAATTKRPKQTALRIVAIKAHKIGAHRIPKRMMLPFKKLGPIWSKKLEAEGKRAARAFIKAGL